MMARWSQAGTVLDRVSDSQERPRLLAELEGPSIGARIRALRLERGWSTQELSEHARLASGSDVLNRTTVWKLENGRRRLQAREAAALARALDVPLDLLVPASGGAHGANPGSHSRPPGDGRERFSPVEDEQEGEPDVVRRVEHDWIAKALSSARGPHLWLVIAPPGLGKTTLVTQLGAELTQGSAGWRVSRVDLRELDAAERTNADSLLNRLFLLDEDQKSSDAAGRHRSIAKELARQGKPFLCVLDSAELLSRDTSKGLRAALSDIYRLVEETGSRRARLGLIVASRLGDDWLGVSPPPPLAVLSVGECGTEFIEDRLEILAARSERVYSRAEMTRMAELVHETTAGLPAVLDPVLEWIEGEQWLELERLRTPEVFESIASDYIGGSLLAPDSIFPRDPQMSEQRLTLMRAAIAYLVRYRFFTWSHVQHHLASSETFRRLLTEAKWQNADFWAALSGMALLKRPLDEPWQEFQPAIRRLLYRHFYAAPHDRAAAHAEAADFVADLTIELTGKEQVVSFVEGLWQTASALRLNGSKHRREELRDFVRTSLGQLRKQPAFLAADLASYTVKRIRNDAELQDAIGDLDGLTDQLIDLAMTGE